MKRPNKVEPNQVLQIHHMVEAYEDDLIKQMKAEGMTPDDVVEILDGKRDGDLSSKEIGYVSAFSTCHIIHNAIHDIMGTSDLRKIEDIGLRGKVVRHIPRVKSRLTAEQYNGYKKELGL